MKDLLRIGELARLGGVSVKTVRFYDEQGLLRPEYVDSQTGYRYYTIDHTKRLAAITNLRAADFSISEITKLLKDGNIPDDFSTAISSKKQALIDQRQEIEKKLKIVEALAKSSWTEKLFDHSTIKLTSLKPQIAHTVRQNIRHLGAPVTQLFETAEADVAAEGMRANAAPFLIYHEPPTKRKNLNIEICIPVTHNAQSNLEVRNIAGSEVACAVAFAGGYFQTDALFLQLQEWIDAAGLQSAGPLREVYHRFGADQDDYRLPPRMIARNKHEFLTELQIPFSLTHNNMESN